jgi:hypothetical protein
MTRAVLADSATIADGAVSMGRATGISSVVVLMVFDSFVIVIRNADVTRSAAKTSRRG